MAVLKVRQEQEDAFRREAEANFNRRVLIHVRRELAELVAALSDEEILGRVRACAPRAARHGLVTETQLMCFVDASFLLGERFEERSAQDWVPKLLNSTKLSPADKANLLLATACSVYQEAKER